MNPNSTTDDTQFSLLEKKPKKSQLFSKIFFFTLGVSSLSGWNAILTGLSYFADQYEGRNVYFILPIPNFLSLCLIGLFLPRISSLLSMFFRIVWSLIILCGLLFLLPMIALEMHSTLGYWLCLATIFIMGIFSALQQNSSIGMSGILGPEYVNVFFIGTGASGTIITIFRLISLAAIDSEKSIFLYIGIAVLWNIGAIVMYFAFTKTPQYRKIIQAHKKGRKSVLVHDQIVTQEEPDNAVQNDSLISDIINSEIANQNNQTETSDHKNGIVPSKQNKDQISIEKMNVIQTLVWINKVAFPIPLLIVILYIQTFMMFPGVAFQKPFDANFIYWGQCFISLGYNFGDTLGKFIAGNRQLFNLQILIGLFLGRFVFYYTFIAIAQGTLAADWITYVNTFLFGILNGFITTGYMILGPEKTNEGFVKEKIGFVSGFALCFGIMLGSFLALPFSNISK
ncbi:unnamed protein product (macronuclear) [Paramecium tetraurelia]|uniref:Uncharacterized protein n=1 Tax=Paramecium tetraurelia TaxID=5888 RepID=A0CPS5_PARTE|nr:uncharacterized protein GSPATT00009184001 [Paramecium tetraurelia]CAK72792.1 unnamed protein product [Paramecium tetraurelia]|eukprot:XP_001440189.1 hypothetical protein (macronuclear) [Paramecium tetraurelia strain d4-2]